ncbi:MULTISPECIES: phospholipid carrier-dependent glycosyltransferase [Cysteiniphilum]|uniref:phospholipid carrier-dependent glycosyltransferase n=1 Tax=Cysteiniphilum TaxID=2056696 RepID=UPI00178476E8|nr:MULTISPECIES: phospholipid carrier-dependent glycosyltransferase [Cysteiniphilum]
MEKKVSRLRWQMDRVFWCDLLLITIIMAIALCLYGLPVLFTPDEGRYAEIAREMVVNHQYIVPHLDGVIYFEKPPMIYWLTALSLKIFGFNIWAARLPNPVLSIIGVWFVYIVCRIVYQKRRVSLWAALITGTSILYLGGGRYLNLDAGVAFFLTITMLSFWASRQYRQTSWQANIWLLNAFIFSGLAVMTKGLIGIVFPMMIIGLWALIVGKYRLLLDYRLYLGLIVVLIISVPWIVAVNNEHPEFFHYYVIVQQILRYATDEQGRQMSKFVYFGIFIIAFFPWFGFLPQVFKSVFTKFKTRKKHENEWFLFVWGMAILLFFAFSKSILMGYLIPIVTPFAILIARRIDKILNESRLRKSTKASIIVALVFFIIIAIAFVILPFIPNFAMFFGGIAGFYWPAAIVSLITAIAGFIYLKRNNLKAIMLWFVCAMMIILNLGWSGSQYFAQKSVRPLTNIVAPLLKTYPHAIVANYGGYYYDAQFYLDRLTWIVANEGELANTAKMPNSGADKTLRTADQFWPVWQSDRRVFVFTDENNYNAYFKAGQPYQGYLLAETPKRFLLTNHPLAESAFMHGA